MGYQRGSRRPPPPPPPPRLPPNAAAAAEAAFGLGSRFVDRQRAAAHLELIELGSPPSALPRRSTITDSAFGRPCAARRVPSSGSTAMSTSRRRAVADHLAVGEHRRLVLLALADHDDAVHVDRVQHGVHAVDRGLVGRLLVAHADERAACSAAASVTRTSSSARLRSGGMSSRAVSQRLLGACVVVRCRRRACAAADDHQRTPSTREEPADCSEICAGRLARAGRRGRRRATSTRATMPTTAVISPRGQESWWSRRMIQARISGATAAASSSQRRIGCASQALNVAARAVDDGVAVVGFGLVPRQEQAEREQQAAEHGEELPASEAAEVHARREPIGCRPRERRAGAGTGRAAALLVGACPRREYVAYHDEEWGRPVRDDRGAVRAALPGGVPVRAVVADDPAQARGLPGRVRRLRARARWPRSATPTSRG